MTLSPAYWDFLGDVALVWGTDWARTLRDEAARGTFAELDGEPCVEGSDDTQDQAAQISQTGRGAVSRCAPVPSPPDMGAQMMLGG